MPQHLSSRIGLVLAISASIMSSPRTAPARAQGASGAPDTSIGAQAPPGASVTRLADGRWLILGGERNGQTLAIGEIVDLRGGRRTTTAVALPQARTAHSATLLPDGTVLILGGRGPAGQILAAPDVFDPSIGSFTGLAIGADDYRADHSATLLTDGRVLVAGGVGADGTPLSNAEVWDVQAGTIAVVGQTTARASHRAELLADGRVALLGGTDATGAPLKTPDVFDPSTGAFAPGSEPVGSETVPAVLAGSLPSDGATGIAPDGRIALRFSRALAADAVTEGSIVVEGPEGPVEISVVAAEGGRLLFVTPRLPLLSDATYLLTARSLLDARGQAVPAAHLTFSTRSDETEGGASPQEEAWSPDLSAEGAGGWTTGRPDSPWRSLPPLAAKPGVTALAGQVLRLDGRPLSRVTLETEGRETRTDGTGRFLLLLDGLATGEHTLEIDGHTADRPGRTYGFYEARISLTAGRTTALPFTIWSPLIDTAHQIAIPSPTPAETVVSTPAIPGLELHLPAGTVIRDEDGEVVRTLTITPVPLDRTPFPLPQDATFTMYFTIQPGGAYVHTPGPIRGGWLVYPNLRHSRTGKRVQFFNYDPDDKGWYVYGMGTVTPTQVVPDPKVRLYAFTGASFNDGNTPPDAGPKPGDCCSNDGDPVNLATGIFTYSMTDLVVPDVIPLAVTRTYNSRDPEPRPFGTGMTHAYAIFQFSALYFQEADLILPDGGKIHYVRISQQGLPWYETVFEHTASPTAFYKSRIAWNGNGWDLTLKDGTVYVFGHGAPLQAIRDRHGNTVRFTWSTTNLFGAGTGNLLRVTSPNGRWIDFTYEPGTTRVSQVQDNLGRTVTYGYDANGNLTSVTDPEQHVTHYTYDAANRLVTVKPRNLDGTPTALVTNTYDTDPGSPTFGWVTKQTHADGGVYSFAYSVTNGLSTQTDVTDPLGHVRRVTFNADGYSLTNTRAYGTADAQTTSSGRQSGSQFVETSTDPHGLETATSYDALGNVATVTRLAGTPNAVTTSYTYEPTYQQVATITDPLQHTTTFEYDAAGNLSRVVDPLQHATTFTYNPQGLTTAVTDALQHTTSFGYTGGDLTTVSDPLGRTTTRLLDGLGRVRTVINPLGQTTRYTYDGNSRVTTATDSIGGQTGFGYFPDGQLEHVTDASQHTTTYTYDPMGRLATRTDPLGRIEYFSYDVEGHPLQWVDRKGQVTLRGYDSLDRLHAVTYNDGSTITSTYDDRDRITQIADSAAGTIGRGYDDLDRLTTETTLQGAISYTYDAADRRATMTVAGQPDVVYSYDDADRLTGLTRDTLGVSLAYDDANRRTSLTLPNGIVTEYGYDDANQLTSLTYLNGQTTLGDLTYTYDLAGQRAAIGGSWARTLLPQPVPSASYDAANELTAWGGQPMAYDANGNLTFDGSLVYGWNARNQLASLAGATSASFQYDSTGRRTAKTIDGTTTAFLYDGVDAVQTDVGGTVNVRLLGTAIDEWFASIRPGGLSLPLVDALGTTLETGDGTASTGQLTYEPYGRSAHWGVVPTERFTGREEETADLYYYRARYYRPSLARFVGEDPIGFGGGVNLYMYAGGEPTAFRDPWGLLIEVLIYTPVGYGKSSYGHAAVNINGQTYSFGEHGWFSEPTSDYMERNSFRDSIGEVLNLEDWQEAALLQLINGDILKNPRWGVNNTCASRLADLIDLVTGPRLGHPITPGDLLSRLQSEGYVSKTNYYPAHKTKIR